MSSMDFFSMKYKTMILELRDKTCHTKKSYAEIEKNLFIIETLYKLDLSHLCILMKLIKYI